MGRRRFSCLGELSKSFRLHALSGPSRARFSIEPVDPLMSVTKKPLQTALTYVVPYSQTPTLSPSSTSTPSNSVPPPPRPYNNYTPQRDSADSPTLYYSSSPSLASRSDEDDEPYLIYSTPLPGTSQPSPPLLPPSPSPSPPVSKPVAPAPAYTPAIPLPHISPPPQAPSSRRIHGRMRSLSSIREEDERGV